MRRAVILRQGLKGDCAFVVHTQLHFNLLFCCSVLIVLFINSKYVWILTLLYWCCVDIAKRGMRELGWEMRDGCNFAIEQVIYWQFGIQYELYFIRDLALSFLRIVVIWIKDWNLSVLLLSWIEDGRKAKTLGWRISEKMVCLESDHFVCPVKIPCLSLSMFGNLTHGNIIWSLLRYFAMVPSLSLVKELSH